MKTPIALLLTLALATDLHAQRIADAVVAYAEASVITPPAPSTATASTASTAASVRGEPSGFAMAMTGALFGAGGVMAGAVVGRQLACGSETDDCGFGSAVLGGLAGEILMLPLGVHIMSDRSTYESKARMSTAMVLAGAILAGPTGGVSMLLIPPAQLIATVAVERRAIRKEERERLESLSQITTAR